MEKITVSVTPAVPESRGVKAPAEYKICIENFVLDSSEIRINLRTSTPGRSRELQLTKNEAMMLAEGLRRFFREDSYKHGRSSGVVLKTVES